jgi:hypothetical protein
VTIGQASVLGEVRGTCACELFEAGVGHFQCAEPNFRERRGGTVDVQDANAGYEGEQLGQAMG